MVNMRTYTMQKATNEMDVGINVGITGLIFSCFAADQLAERL